MEWTRISKIITSLARSLQPQMSTWRRDLHRYPELAYQEHRTSKIIEQVLTEAGFTTTRCAKTGVVTCVNEDIAREKVLAYRFDMDGLPLQEEGTQPYRSRVDGVMHACGHDGHVAIGLGLALILKKYRHILDGKVKLIFQPAEESVATNQPFGAKKMIQEGVLEKPKVNAIVAPHLWTEMPINYVGIKEGPIMTGWDKIELTIIGESCTSARPDLGIDALLAASHTIIALQNLASRMSNPLEPVTITIGQITGGEAINNLAKSVNFKGSVRCTEERQRQDLPKQIKQITNGISQLFGTECHFKIEKRSPFILNHPVISNCVEQAAKDVNLQIERLPLPRMSGDDFSFFSEQLPAAYVPLGAGGPDKKFSYPSHHPKFDFNEEVLANGAALMFQIALRYLGFSKESPDEP